MEGLRRELEREEFVRFPWNEVEQSLVTQVECIIPAGGNPHDLIGQTWCVGAFNRDMFDRVAQQLQEVGNCLEGLPEIWDWSTLLEVGQDTFFPGQYAAFRMFSGVAAKSRKGMTWAFDCDGTLFPTGVQPHTQESLHAHITEHHTTYRRFRGRISQHVKRGGRLAICTGRSSAFVIPALREVFQGFAYTLIGEGGAEILEVDSMGRAGLLETDCFSPGGVLTRIRDDLARRLTQAFGCDLQEKRVIVTASRPLTVPIEIFYARVQAAVRNWYPEDFDQLYITHSQNAVDISLAGVDKGSAIRSVRTSGDFWTYFGDAPNDIPGMLACDSVVLVAKSAQDSVLEALRSHSICVLVSESEDIYGCLEAMNTWDRCR